MPNVIEPGFAKVFKALGNETRLAIFNYVRSQEYDCRSGGNDECCVRTEDRTVCVSHISKKFGHIGQAAISQHLKVLHESGILRRHKIGSWVYYTIASEPLQELQRYFAQQPETGNGREPAFSNSERS